MFFEIDLCKLFDHNVKKKKKNRFCLNIEDQEPKCH